MRPCSEFPNDNEALHLGVCWGCEDVTETAHALPRVRRNVEAKTEAASESRFEPASASATELESDASLSLSVVEDEDEDDTIEILVEPLEAFGAEDELEIVAAADVTPEPAATSIPPPLDDPFQQLVALLADLAIDAGDTVLAEALPRLLLEGEVPREADETTRRGLTTWLHEEGGTVRAWRAILRGEGEDYSACGAATLDEWASSVVARLLGAPERAPTFRRDLRSRGVAAYGLCDAAA